MILLRQQGHSDNCNIHSFILQRLFDVQAIQCYNRSIIFLAV